MKIHQAVVFEALAGLQFLPGFRWFLPRRSISYKEIYEAMRRCDKVMCEALRELMKEDFEKQEQETKQETLLEAIRNLMDSMKWTADQAMTAMKIPDADRSKYNARL